MKNGQIIRDLGGEHIAKSFGRCIACNRVTWGFVDHECPDWRGPFGDSTHDAMQAEDYDMQGPDFPICANCANTRESYERALRYAKSFWKPCPANS